MNEMEQQNFFTDVESCPIRNVVARFSGKWAMLILCYLAENEATRFSVMDKALPDISPKMLTETLKNLEMDGLVTRKVYAEVPPRVEYSLTGLGKSLMPHLRSLIGWALENSRAISENRKRYAKRQG